MRGNISFEPFTLRLRDFIDSSVTKQEGDHQRSFDRLGLELFALQFEHNPIYRQFCENRDTSPRTVEHWTQVPSMPTAAFKEFEVSCLPFEERTAVFHSSGTTEHRPSRHFHSATSLAIYETSLLTWFSAKVMDRGCGRSISRSVLPLRASADSMGASNVVKAAGAGLSKTAAVRLEAGNWRLLILTPSPAQAPHSSLVHMFDTIRHTMGAPANAFLGKIRIDTGWDLNLEAAVSSLKDSCSANLPCLLLGTAFSFVHLLDYLAAQKLYFHLPSGSFALETGGYKGRARSLPKAQLRSLISSLLGIQPEKIIGEYGMSELSSQAYDCIQDLESQSPARPNHSFHFPPWARPQIISPETGREVDPGQTGLIRMFDLANVYSVMAVQTEDLAIRRGNGFELVGRAALAETRGCSLMAVEYAARAQS